ncbi:hypothetical protein DRJ17_00535 [Candidatus Woesearchaeota archaeon]|nr:MAG: hypothetical protein DRJ17_00535 [Candidatus Woesearchaeota archaeon]
MERLEDLIQDNRIPDDLKKKLTEAYEIFVEEREYLQQQEKLITAGEITSGIAHDINNYLTNAFGYLELYLMTKDNSSSEVKNLIQVKIALEHIKDMVMTLLEYSKYSISEKSKINLKDCYETALKLCQHKLIKQGVLIEKKDWNVPLKIIGNKTQLTQVYLNLFLNAADAMPRGGNITLTNRIEGDYIISSISDTGYGISSEDIDKIFQSFYTTKKNKGTGLGLSICKRIIEDHGGKIIVESESNRGSTFTLQLPAYKGE